MINSHFGFTKLKEVWLGDCYPESFYDHLPNSISDPFQEITQRTKKDLNAIEKFLTNQGITVQRPKFTSIDDYLTDYDTLAKPPITPRDDYLVLGNTLYSLHNQLEKDPWQSILDDYIQSGYDVQQPIDQPINCLCPPSVVRIGKDLYVDMDSHRNMWGYACEALVELAKSYRVNLCNTDGHSDGVFCPAGNGLLVTSHWKADYSESFPGWEIFKIPETSNFVDQRKWSVDNITDANKSFSKYLQESAKAWIGDFQETVFEVNMLVIDEQNVLAIKEHDGLARWLETHGITMHVLDFQTRNFWDGGLHCLTLDIHREDTKQDVFPDRGQNGLYWRID